MSAVLASGRTRAARVAANVLVFQAAWFACVGSAANGVPAFGIAAVAVALAIHFALSTRRAVDAQLVALCVGAGLVFDTIAIRAGWIAHASPGPLSGFAPAWIVALWALFATALREPLAWLRGRHGIAALFGAVGGPLSYAAAARMGACRFEDYSASMATLGIGWAAMTPLLVEAARRIEAGESVR